MGTLARYLKPFLPSIIIVFVFAIASTVFAIVGPKILGNATTEIFNGVMGKMARYFKRHRFRKVGEILLTLLGIYLVSAAFFLPAKLLMTGVSMKLTYRLRKEISEKINRLPLSYFDTRTHGEVLSRVTNDIDTVSNSLNQSLTQLITAITTIVGVLIMMFSISWLLTVVTLIIIPIALLLVMVIVKRSQKHFINQQRYLGRSTGTLKKCTPATTSCVLSMAKKKALKSLTGSTKSSMVRREIPVSLRTDDADYAVCRQPWLCGGLLYSAAFLRCPTSSGSAAR